MLSFVTAARWAVLQTLSWLRPGRFQLCADGLAGASWRRTSLCLCTGFQSWNKTVKIRRDGWPRCMSVWGVWANNRVGLLSLYETENPFLCLQQANSVVKVISEELPINMQGRQRVENLDGFYNVKPNHSSWFLCNYLLVWFVNERQRQIFWKQNKTKPLWFW